jgi:hypothetical protein
VCIIYKQSKWLIEKTLGNQAAYYIYMHILYTEVGTILYMGVYIYILIYVYRS